MSKYTAEQVRDWHRRESSWRNQLRMYESEKKHSEMADAIDALLRERESAKVVVTDEIAERALNQYVKNCLSHLDEAPVSLRVEAMRAALEAVMGEICR